MRGMLLGRARQHPQRYTVVDADGPFEQVADRVAAAVGGRLDLPLAG